MTNAKTVRVGVMPGKIQEFGVEVGASIRSLLEVAELDATGYDVKVDGVKVDNLDETITFDTSLVLLVKQVKGNANGEIKIGVMPGRINTYAIQDGITVNEALRLAELDAQGYDVKIDGEKVTDLSQAVPSTANLILLAKQVKGN